MQPIFTDDGLMLKLNVTHKLRKLLQREGKGYQSMLYHRVGVGLTEAEFEQCVKLLAVSGWCTVTKGEREAPILTLNEAFRNVRTLSPEEVIKDACKEEAS